MRRCALFVIAVLVCTACSRSSTTESATTDAAASPAAAADETPVKPVPAELPDIVARVNGETISKQDLQKAVEAIEAQNGGAVPAEQRDRVYRDVLGQLINFKLLIQESRARKLTVADAELNARMAEIQGQFPSEEAYRQTLAQQQLTPEQLRDDARSEMLVTKMLQAEVDPKVAVTPTEVQDFYAGNPDRFKQGERVRASHILLRLPEQADAAAKEAVRTRAADVLKQVRAGGDFAALARQHSEDPGSAPGGGDLNYFPKGQMVEPFDQAVFALKVGDVSDLVETQFGFHIIKLVDKQAERVVPLDEVRPQVQQFLENQERQEQTEAFIKSLAGKGTVEILI